MYSEGRLTPAATPPEREIIFDAYIADHPVELRIATSQPMGGRVDDGCAW